MPGWFMPGSFVGGGGGGGGGVGCSSGAPSVLPSRGVVVLGVEDGMPPVLWPAPPVPISVPGVPGGGAFSVVGKVDVFVDFPSCEQPSPATANATANAPANSVLLK